MVLSLPGSNRACAGWKLGCHRERRSEHLTEEGRINRLMFWAAAARKNCSRTNFILRKRSRRSPIWFLVSANSPPTLFLCRCAFAKPDVFAKARARCRAGHACGWHDTSTARWCIAFVVRTPHNVCGSRYRGGYGSEHCVLHS
jgi:hypothetical protein